MFKFALALSLLPLAFAQYGGYGPAPGTTSSSSSSAAASASGTASNQMFVKVASDGLTYTPSDIKASVGTLVTFVFPNAEHSVTESSFSDPCTPNGSGFDSGVTSGTTFSVNVTDASTPVYFFCKVPSHCGLGMVGTINAPASGSGSNSAFVSAAKAIGSGESALSQGTAFKTGGQGAVATAGPTSGTPTVSSASTTASTSKSASPTTSGGAAQLSVSGGLGLLGAIAGLFIAL